MRRSVLLVAVVAVAVAACTPSESEPTTTVTSTSLTPASTTTTTQPPDGFGGTIRVGVEVLPRSLNPFSTDASFATTTVGNAVWAKVYDLDPATGERVADNITELPSRVDGGIVDNGDGTITVQYQVARRATWSDGVPITGADLAFTAEVMSELATSGNPAVDPIMASVVEVDSVEQVAWITYSKASLAVEDALWIILPAHALEGSNITSSDGLDWPAGGPFMVDGDPTSLVRNPNYWKTDDAGRQLPYADAVEIVAVLDEPLASFRARAVDVISLNATQDMIASVEGLESDGAEAQVVASPIVEHITFNLSDTRLELNERSFNTRAVYREAVAHAVDRPALIAEAGVPWLPASGLLVPTSDAWSRYGFNPTEARSLVSSLDATEAPVAVLSTTVNADERPSVAEAFRGAFAPIGVEYQTDLQDSLLFFQTSLPAGAYDLGMWAWLNDGTPTRTIALMDLFDPASGNGSLSGWGAEGSDTTVRFSELVEIARTALDAPTFDAAVAEAEEILATELSIIPLFHRTVLAAVWSDTITGVAAPGTEDNLTWNIEMWQVIGE